VRLIRLIVEILQGQGRYMTLSVICGVVFAGTNLIPPLLIRRMIEWIVEGGADESDLIGVTVSLFGLYLLRGATRYGYGVFSHMAAYRVMCNLMNRVYQHIQHLSHRFLNDQRTGSLMTRSINDIETVEDFIAHGIPETLLALIIPTSMMTVLFILNPTLAIVALVPIPFASWLVYKYVSPVRQMWRGVRESLTELIASVQDNISGITVIKSFAQEKNSAEQIKEKSVRFRDEMIKANTVSLLPAGIIEAVGGLGVVLVIWSGGGMAMRGQVSVADIFIFVVYMGHIYQPFLTLASINDVLQKATTSIDRVFELLAEESDIVDKPNSVAPNDIKFNISFDNVTFGYEKGVSILHDISFDVDQGEIVALVGPTGAGKTTICNLIPRFWDTDIGLVQVGGYEVSNLKLQFLRRSIAAVLQDVFLFHGTVIQNILFGRPEATEKEVVLAAQIANAEEFILDMPNGYQSVIGERGVRLSGGQKQRLSIARAILKDAPILILDEATSAIDVETESLIQQAINRLVSNRTVVVIAHRLSTIRNADKVIVLENGHIVESGSPSALIEKNGTYARILKAQDVASDWSFETHVD
jgi:ATP-binding cassette subfamily B protein